jgi:hypothetical protein
MKRRFTSDQVVLIVMLVLWLVWSGLTAGRSAAPT